MKKEGTINMTYVEMSDYWRGMREYKIEKQQQQSLAVTNPYSMKPYKSLIPDRYKNWMELKKIKSEN